MSGGLDDMNWSIRLEEQRKEYKELEKVFIENPSKEKATKLVKILGNYLSMKKGQCMWAQIKRNDLAGYISGEISEEKILLNLKQYSGH